MIYVINLNDDEPKIEAIEDYIINGHVASYYYNSDDYSIKTVNCNDPFGLEFWSKAKHEVNDWAQDQSRQAITQCEWEIARTRNKIKTLEALMNLTLATEAGSQ